MTKPKDPEDLRFCCIANGGCKAPAGFGISGVGTAPGDKGTQGTCFGCGEPVCAGENCSRRMDWVGSKRKRICRNCHDPEELARVEADKKTRTTITLATTEAGLQELWRKVLERDPATAALFRQFKVLKFGVWDIGADGFMILPVGYSVLKG